MIIQVGQAIGVWWTIALLIADSILGALLMRHRAARRGGASTTRSPRAASRRARSIDGVLVIFGGALLLTPGFITDIFGAGVPAAADARGRAAACSPASAPRIGVA